MCQLPPFYAHVVRSYAYVNNIYYESVNGCSLPHNLWCGKLYSHVDKDWVATGLYTIANLPIIQGKIDVMAIMMKLHSVGCWRSPYLLCCTFQANFANFFIENVSSTFVPNDLLPLVMKYILRSETSQMLTLNNWCCYFDILPFKVPEKEKKFLNGCWLHAR